ncbi:MAG TPA: class I SAM-dependent methyltransferase [Pyrinomonadaceae bacterium]
MGLDEHGIRFLLLARENGVSFSETAMLGRQTMMTTAAQLTDILSQIDLRLTETEAENLLAEGFAEPFLKLLGAQKATSFDASDFENATFVHDFNRPIPERFKNKFSVVIDGGTLEHVFNFPTAIKNCMEMVAEGGHFISLSPANNYMGHGFYQFSPELFFRVLDASNGFRIERLFIYEQSIAPEWFAVSDPDAIKDRVTLVNDQPSLMLILAKKIETVEIFKEFPQQSDYVVRWHGKEGDDFERLNGSTTPKLSLARILRTPFAALRRAQTVINHRFGMLNRSPKHFKKMDP